MKEKDKCVKEGKVEETRRKMMKGKKIHGKTILFMKVTKAKK